MRIFLGPQTRAYLWGVACCLLLAVASLRLNNSNSLGAQRQPQGEPSPTSMIIAISGGDLDVQEEGHYEKLHGMVQRIRGQDLKSVGLIRHVSEWKWLCEELQDQFFGPSDHTLSLIPDARVEPVEWKNLLSCLERRKQRSRIQVISTYQTRR